VRQWVLSFPIPLRSLFAAQLQLLAPLLAAIFHDVAAPTVDELQVLLAKIITRIMRLLIRQGFLIEEQSMTHLAETDRDPVLTPLQAASCIYRIALGPRAAHQARHR